MNEPRTPDRPDPVGGQQQLPPGPPDDISWADALAWRHLRNQIGAEFRRALLRHVYDGQVPLDSAQRALHRAGLPGLHLWWTVTVTGTATWRRSDPGAGAPLVVAPDDLQHLVQEALVPHGTVSYRHARHGHPRNPSDADARNGPVEMTPAPALVVTVQAPSRDDARTTVTGALYDATATACLDLTGMAVVRIEPDCDLDRDAPYPPPATDPAVSPGRVVLEAGDARRLARQGWQWQTRLIRTALIDLLDDGDLGDLPAGQRPYALVDEMLRGLGLAGLPRAHLYRVSLTVPVTVPAGDPHTARIAAYRLLADVSARHPQYGTPLTHADTHREPDLEPLGDGVYLVLWHMSYLVCLRAVSSPRLAEQTVRLHLSAMADTVPAISTVRLVTDYLGEHADHRLDPDRD